MNEGIRVKIILTLVFVLLWLGSIHVVGWREHAEESFFLYATVTPKTDFTEAKTFDKDLGTSAEGWGNPKPITMYLSKPTRIGRILLLGNPSPDAAEIEIFYNGLWKEISGEKVDLGKMHVSDREVKTDVYASAVRLTWENSGPGDYYKIKEVVIQEKTEVPAAVGILRYLFVIPRNVASYFFYAALFLLLFHFSLLPIARRVAVGSSNEILFSCSAVIFILLGLGISLLTILSKSDLPSTVFLGLSFIFAVVNFFREKWESRTFFAGALALVGIFMVLNLGLNLFLDYFGEGIFQWDSLYDSEVAFKFPYKNYEQDYITPYATSKIIFHGLSMSDSESRTMMGVNWITDRPPLWSMFLIPFLTAFGERFFIFEILGSFMSTLMIYPLIALLSSFFNRRVSIVTTTFFLSTHFILFFVKMTQLKAIALFFVFIFFVACFKTAKRKNLLLVGGLFSLAYLIHPLAIIYSVGFFYPIFHIIRSGEKYVSCLKNIIALLIIPIFTIAGWGALSSRIGRQNALSSYWLAYDYNAIVKSQEGNIPLGIPLNRETFANLFRNKIYNTLSLFLPDPHPTIRKSWDFFRNTFPGAINVVYFLVTVAAVVAGAKRNIRSRFFYLILLGPIIAYILIFLGFYNDLGLMFYLEGVVPITLSLAVTFLLSFHRKVLTMGVIFIGIFESLFVNLFNNYFISPIEVKNLLPFSEFGFRLGLILLISGYLLLLPVFLYVFLSYTARIEPKDNSHLDFGKM